MSYSCQNYIFEIPTKTNNSQTFVQTNNLGPLAWARFFFFFEILFLLRLFGFFRVRSIFFHVLQYLSMYLPPTPCFSRFSRSGPVFPGFPGAVGTLRHRGGPTTSKHTHTHTHTHTHNVFLKRTGLGGADFWPENFRLSGSRHCQENSESNLQVQTRTRVNVDTRWADSTAVNWDFLASKQWQ